LPSDIVLPTLNLTTAPSFTDLDLSGVSVPANSLLYTSAGAEPNDVISMGSLPVYSGPTAFTFSTTDIQDALDKAKTLIDDGGTVGGDSLGATKSVQGRLATDDGELSGMTAQAASVEQQRASHCYSK